MRGRLDVRDIEDIGDAALSYNEVKALTILNGGGSGLGCVACPRPAAGPVTGDGGGVPVAGVFPRRGGAARRRGARPADHTA
jgi:hypothetical protein